MNEIEFKTYMMKKYLPVYGHGGRVEPVMDPGYESLYQIIDRDDRVAFQGTDHEIREYIKENYRWD